MTCTGYRARHDVRAARSLKFKDSFGTPARHSVRPFATQDNVTCRTNISKTASGMLRHATSCADVIMWGVIARFYGVVKAATSRTILLVFTIKCTAYNRVKRNAFCLCLLLNVFFPVIRTTLKQLVRSMPLLNDSLIITNIAYITLLMKLTRQVHRKTARVRGHKLVNVAPSSKCFKVLTVLIVYVSRMN